MGKNNEKKKRTAGDVILTLILLVAVGVFCFAGYNLFKMYMDYKEGRDQYQDIADMAVSERDPDAHPGADGLPTGDPGSETYIAPPIDVDFASLKAINDDVIGWIHVEAFDGMSYPVVRGIDNEYYLHRGIHKEYIYAGTIFADSLNKDSLDECYTILYGHNMNDGSMFGKLSDFISDPKTLKKSPYFWVFTPEAARRYQIISVYNAPLGGDTYTYYKGPGKEFQEFLSKVQGYSEVKIDPVELDLKDKLVCLSTCLDNHDYSKRCVVIGKMIDEVPMEQVQKTTAATVPEQEE